MLVFVIVSLLIRSIFVAWSRSGFVIVLVKHDTWILWQTGSKFRFVTFLIQSTFPESCLDVNDKLVE